MNLRIGIGNKTIKEFKKRNIYSINNLKKAVKNKRIKLTEQQKIGLKYVNLIENKIPRKTIVEITKYLFKNK